jgi:hypothetical protein
MKKQPDASRGTPKIGTGSGYCREIFGENAPAAYVTVFAPTGTDSSGAGAGGGTEEQVWTT